MKAIELMIGDWVVDGKKTAQITGVFCDDLFETTLSPSVGGDCIEPIPLTDEILVNNGFSKEVNGDNIVKIDTYWLGEGLGGFRVHKINEGYYQFGLAKIRYVHQLQHALRLCEIDKEITLDNV